MTSIDVHVVAMDKVVTNLPPGSVVRVHGPDISGEFTAPSPDVPTILTIPSDRGRGLPAWYPTLDMIRDRCFPADREMWRDIIESIRDGGVVVVHGEERDFYGRTRWAAAGFAVHQAGPAGLTRHVETDPVDGAVTWTVRGGGRATSLRRSLAGTAMMSAHSPARPEDAGVLPCPHLGGARCDADSFDPLAEAECAAALTAGGEPGLWVALEHHHRARFGA